MSSSGVTGGPETTVRRRLLDVHRHLMTPGYVAMREAEGLRMLGWTARMNPTSALEEMDAGAVTMAMLSAPTPPATVGHDLASIRRFCRENNDYLAGVCAQHPGRFGFFACLPLPDVQASLEEIGRALDSLGADGVHLFTSYGDRWLADPNFAPVYDELEARAAVVYTHPRTPDCCEGVLSELGVSDATIEYGTDTARAVLQLVFGGTVQRCPSIRLIFSHAGGTMPALFERFSNLAATERFARCCPNGFAASASRFFYDTAQSANPAAMSALVSFVPVSQILFGTDFPWRDSDEHLVGLRSCGLFGDEELAAIEWSNGARLLERAASAEEGSR